MQSFQDYDFTFKVVLVGDAGCGKSSLVHRFVRASSAQPPLLSTIGVEYEAKVVRLSNDTKVKLQMWDTGGQDNYRVVVRSYYHNATCLVFVYDVTKSYTFRSVQNWLEDVRQTLAPKSVLVLVGNKIDLRHRREISTLQGEQFANSNGMKFFETSAKTAQNVGEMFMAAAHEAHDRYVADSTSLDGVTKRTEQCDTVRLFIDDDSDGDGDDAMTRRQRSWCC